MPVQQCQANGKPGYKWGESGHCYTYEPGSEIGRAMAKNKAEAQGQAIHAQQHAKIKEDDEHIRKVIERNNHDYKTKWVE
jgi:hypothetical protein